jgi:hypothetical protein
VVHQNPIKYYYKSLGASPSGSGVLWNTNRRIGLIEVTVACNIIGLPKKNGVEKPLFDYQKMILDALLIPGSSQVIRNSKGRDFIC